MEIKIKNNDDEFWYSTTFVCEKCLIGIVGEDIKECPLCKNTNLKKHEKGIQ